MILAPVLGLSYMRYKHRDQAKGPGILWQKRLFIQILFLVRCDASYKRFDLVRGRTVASLSEYQAGGGVARGCP